MGYIEGEKKEIKGLGEYMNETKAKEKHGKKGDNMMETREGEDGLSCKIGSG